MNEKLSYASAGVDVAGADTLVDTFTRLMQDTHGLAVVTHPSRYAGLFRLPLNGVEDPLLAVTCDGVGTKLLVAKAANHYAGLGQDLVAMSVNDLLPLGATPLVFLDYLATGKLDPQVLPALVGSIALACKEVGCALIGGETAEMPGLYPPGDFDLAGFAVGLCDGAKLPDPTTLRAGDVLLGLPATGVHSNGFSLARRALFDHAKLPLDHLDTRLGRPLAAALLEPTPLYVAPMRALTIPFKAAAHITGGGLFGRLHKLVPQALTARVDPGSYAVPPIFALIAESGPVDPVEMHRTFNMGLGFVVAVDAAHVGAALASHPDFRVVGELVPRADNQSVVLGDLRH